MKQEIIKLSKSTVVFSTERPREIGEKMDLEIDLPKDSQLAFLTLTGTVTDLRHIRNNGTSVYELEMLIGDLPQTNSLILDTYIDFLEREKRLNRIRTYNIELQNALNNLKDKLTQLVAVSELLIKEAEGKTTIH